MAQVADERTRYSILTSAAVSVLGFFLTLRLIPLTKAYTLKAGLFGMDINKKGSREGEKKVPESLGLAAGVVFLVRRHLGDPCACVWCVPVVRACVCMLVCWAADCSMAVEGAAAASLCAVLLPGSAGCMRSAGSLASIKVHLHTSCAPLPPPRLCSMEPPFDADLCHPIPAAALLRHPLARAPGAGGQVGRGAERQQEGRARERCMVGAHRLRRRTAALNRRGLAVPLALAA